MRSGFVCGWRRHKGWLVLLAVLLVGVPGVVLAQDGMAEGGGAFSGGQMVRGTVTAVAADRLTVKTEEGEVYQVAVSANTRVMKDRQPMKLAEIKAGDGVGAMGVMDAPTKTVHAVFVAVIDAEQVKKAREGLGKIYITGKVTAIDMDDAKVTVMRPDHVSQVIQADEGTSFKRGGRREQAVGNAVPATGNTVPAAAAGANAGGESITLADVKVGDLVMGRGAVKNGLFVPAELRVMDAAARERRRAPSASASTGSPNANGSESPK
jgi:hypothetical protein